MKKTSLIILFITIFTLLVACGGTKEVTDYALVLSIDGKKIAGTFDGEIEKKDSGSGTFSVKTDDHEWEYKGSFESMTPNGEGEFINKPTLIEFQSNKYEGFFTGRCNNGIPTYGDFTYEKDDDYVKYKGEIKNTHFYGNGTIETNIFLAPLEHVERIGTYKGDLFNGIAKGSGAFIAETDDGTTYTTTGEWSDDLPNGYCTQFFDDETWDRYGTFLDGNFSPTFSEAFFTIGTNSDMSFSVSNKAKDFIDTHKDLFPAESTEELNSYIDNSTTYEQYKKSPKDYNDKVIQLKNIRVFQAFENSYYGYVITKLFASDSNGNIHTIFLHGSYDVYENDRVNIYAVPIDNSSYKNVAGSTTLTTIYLGCLIEK